MSYEVNPRFVRLIQQAADLYLNEVTTAQLSSPEAITEMTASAFLHVAPLVSCILGPVVFLNPSPVLLSVLLDRLLGHMKREVMECCEVASAAADKVSGRREMPEC